MSNSIASISSAMAILKNWYEGPIVSQFNDEMPFYKYIEKGKEKWNGLQVVRPIKVRRNPGIGATSDGGSLPKIGQQGTTQATIAAKYNYLRFGLTAPLIKASQGDKGAFISAMEFEMQEGLNDLKNNINRQLFWDGTGTLATVSANAVASTTITCTGRTSSEDGSKYLDVGLCIDIYSSAGVLRAQAVTINAVSGTTTATLTLDSAVTCSATDIVVLNNSYNNEIQGLLTAMDGGTSSIYGVNRTTYPIFNGISYNSSSAQLNLNLMKIPYNQAKQKGGAKIDVTFCDFDSERYYEKLLVADKRYVGRVTGDGTFSSKDGSYLEYAESKVIPDKDCPLSFYFLTSKVWKKYVLAELEWADETGSYLIAQTNADAFEARLRLFANLFPEKPIANARLHSYISP